METKPDVEHPRTCTAQGGLSPQGSVELFRSSSRDIRAPGAGAPCHLEMEGGAGAQGALPLQKRVAEGWGGPERKAGLQEELSGTQDTPRGPGDH